MRSASGVGIVLAADVLSQAIHIFGALIFRGFEHDVFKQMRESRTAVRIILAANMIPDLNSHRGTRMIFHRQHREAVGQSALSILHRRDV